MHMPKAQSEPFETSAKFARKITGRWAASFHQEMGWPVSVKDLVSRASAASFTALAFALREMQETSLCHGTRRAADSFLRVRPASSRKPQNDGSAQDHLPSMRLTVSKLSQRHTIWILWQGLLRVAPQRDTSDPRRARREQEPVVDTGSGTATVVSGASAGVRKSSLVQFLAPTRSREILRKV